jgi:hypothetical protein
VKKPAYEILRIFIVGWSLVAAAGTSRAARIALYETGAPDLGTASAGWAAMAADASTVATNPAGMTSLDRTLLMITSGAMLPANQLRSRSQNDCTGRWRRQQRWRVFSHRLRLLCAGAQRPPAAGSRVPTKLPRLARER